MAVISGRGVATGRPVSDVPSGRTENDVSQREDLANFISMITRDETPFMSSLGKTKAPKHTPVSYTHLTLPTIYTV